MKSCSYRVDKLGADKSAYGKPAGTVYFTAVSVAFVADSVQQPEVSAAVACSYNDSVKTHSLKLRWVGDFSSKMKLEILKLYLLVKIEFYDVRIHYFT